MTSLNRQMENILQTVLESWWHYLEKVRKDETHKFSKLSVANSSVTVRDRTSVILLLLLFVVVCHKARVSATRK